MELTLGGKDRGIAQDFMNSPDSTEAMGELRKRFESLRNTLPVSFKLDER